MSPTFFEGWQHLLPRIADAAVRGAVVLLAALALTHLLRRRSAATRHAVWVGAITAQLLLLVLGIAGPRWRVSHRVRVPIRESIAPPR